MKKYLKKAGWSALIGGIALAAVFIIPYLIFRNRILLWNSFSRGPLNTNIILYLVQLPKRFLLYLFSGKKALLIFYEIDILTFFSPLIIGAILGIVFLSWARSPWKRFLKMAAAGAGVVLLMILIGSIYWHGEQSRELQPPFGYSGPDWRLPEGFTVREISAEEYLSINKVEPAPFKDDRGREVLLEHKAGTEEYRICYDSDGPWFYTLEKRQTGETEWRRLGPMLISSGNEGVPVFDLAASRNFIHEHKLEWILYQGREFSFNLQYPAHKREKADNGKMWLCCLPLETFKKDRDSDGFTDMEEAIILTNPERSDTDGDGIPDGKDPSPLGWYRSNGTRASLQSAVIRYGEKKHSSSHHAGYDRMDLIISPGPRIHIEHPGTIYLTLTEDEYRNRFFKRNGCSVWSFNDYFFYYTKTYIGGFFGAIEHEGGGFNPCSSVFFRLPGGEWNFVLINALFVYR